MEQAFLKDLENSEEIRIEDWKRRSMGKRVGDRVARWLSPLL